MPLRIEHASRVAPRMSSAATTTAFGKLGGGPSSVRDAVTSQPTTSSTATPRARSLSPQACSYPCNKRQHMRRSRITARAARFVSHFRTSVKCVRGGGCGRHAILRFLPHCHSTFWKCTRYGIWPELGGLAHPLIKDVTTRLFNFVQVCCPPRVDITGCSHYR